MAVEVSVACDRLRNAVCEFLANSNDVSVESTRFLAGDTVLDAHVPRTVALSLGYGATRVRWRDADIVAERRRTGPPVANSGRGSSVLCLDELILAGDQGAIVELLEAAYAWMRPGGALDDRIDMLRWDAEGTFWRHETEVPKRALSTIFLDPQLRATLLCDLEDFDSEPARAWYRAHAIPYRRGYLLHGPPGTGKSSLIVGIATHLDRAIHRIHLVAPRLDDGSLAMAMHRVPVGSVVVLEDIDALFGVHREKNESSNVTFSGLLNAIDGIGDSTKGTLYIMTTNHPERLDAALRRRGRIDVDFAVGPCVPAQSQEMFLSYYPGAAVEAATFASRVASLRRAVTPSELQELFVKHRKSDAAAAVAAVAQLSPPLEQASQSMWN